MKNKNDFVYKKNDNWISTLEEAVAKSKEVRKKIEDLKTRLEELDDLLENSDDNENINLINFKEQTELYRVIDFLIQYNGRPFDFKRMGIDLFNLRSKLESNFNELHEYKEIKRCIKSSQDEYNKLLSEDTILFRTMLDGYHLDYCSLTWRHYFIDLGDELKCAFCGGTTKDYDLTKEEFEFLKDCAYKQSMILKGATKEDFPLIEVIKERQEYKKEDDSDEYDVDFSEVAGSDNITNADMEMKKIIRAAHHLDDKNIMNDYGEPVYDPAYYNEQESKRMLKNIYKDIEEAKLIESENKDLIIEMCNTVKYEILILSGKHIPTMYKEAKNEDEKIALIKAYYNLYNYEYRDCSGYFNKKKNRCDSYTYDCATADSEINKRILEMRIKR